MLKNSWKQAASGLGLMASVLTAGLTAGAEEAPSRAGYANLPAIHQPADGGTAERTKPGPAPDVRALLADSAIRNFVGLTENAYDFSDPNGVPGFGPLPPNGSETVNNPGQPPNFR